MSVDKAVAILRDPEKRTAAGILSPSEHTEAFYQFIADRLAGRVAGATVDSEDKELVPEGYNLCIELAFFDARRGVDGFTDAPIRAKFVGLPLSVLIILRMPLFEERVVTALFDEAFARRVREIRGEVARDRALDVIHEIEKGGGG